MNLLPVLIFLGIASTYAFQCPPYDAIRTPSVSTFDPYRYQGLWYQVATNEPTMPSFCTCGTLNWTVTSPTTFSDGFSSKCGGLPLHLPLEGTLSSNASAPGFLHEGPSMSLLVPNMVFYVQDAYQFAAVYSCVYWGKFSLQLLSRTPNISMDYVRGWVMNLTAQGIMDTSGMRYDNFAEC